MPIPITATLALDEAEIAETFVHASGPGGQNVNKVATAVQVRFDVTRSHSLPDEVKLRLLRLAGKRATREGVLIILAQRFRSQERNRQDAAERLIALVRQAAERPPLRRPTRPSAAERRRRIEAKARRAGLKALRRPPASE